MTKPTSSTWRMAASQSAILARGPLGSFPSHESADELRRGVSLAHRNGVGIEGSGLSTAPRTVPNARGKVRHNETPMEVVCMRGPVGSWRPPRGPNALFCSSSTWCSRRLAASQLTTVFTPPRHASPAWVLSPTSNDVSIAARGYQPARATARGQANRAARVMLALPERQPAPSPPFWAAGRCWPSPAARAILSMVRHTHVARHSAALLCRRRYALLEPPPTR